ncbi:hypothetical protein ABNG02_15720 [Halorubrum ejinorense]|uniref:Uncharacterized protein n=1 Tax=Halorubrum ejinorense TaxID=425309 RepID=A0AAV3SRX0_9EURY
MTEFETQNTVEVIIDDRSLTEAKADVEEALSSVPMDVQASVSGGGGGSGGGGAADEWREQHSLSRERNRLLEELVDAQEEGNFDRAARSAGGLLGGGAAILGAGALLGVGALSSVLSSFSWPELPKLEPPGWLPPRVPEPDWHPLDVVEPDPVPIEQPDPLPVEQPDPVPIADPTSAPASDPQPGGTSSPDGAPAPPDDIQQIQDGPPRAGPTTSPGLSTKPAADEVSSSIGLPEALLGGASAAAGFAGIKAIQNIGGSAAGSAASGGAFLTPESVGVTDPGALNQRRQAINQRTPDWANLSEIPEDKFSGSVFSAEGRQAQGKALQDAASRIEEAIGSLLDGNTTDDDNPQQRNDIRVESNVTVDGATRQEIERAAEEAKREALRKFNQEISGRVR